MQLDSKSSTTIEATEDAIGDEVFYAYLKRNPKTVEDVDVDDEQRFSFRSKEEKS